MADSKISALTAKTTLHANDIVPILDSEAANANKRTTIGSILATNQRPAGLPVLVTPPLGTAAVPSAKYFNDFIAGTVATAQFQDDNIVSGGDLSLGHPDWIYSASSTGNAGFGSSANSNSYGIMLLVTPTVAAADDYVLVVPGARLPTSGNPLRGRLFHNAIQDWIVALGFAGVNNSDAYYGMILCPQTDATATWVDSPEAQYLDGVVFVVQNGVGRVDLLVSGVAEDTVPLLTNPLVAGTPYKLEIAYSASAGLISVYLNGTIQGTLDTVADVLATAVYGPIFEIKAKAVNTSRTFSLDWFYLERPITRP